MQIKFALVAGTAALLSLAAVTPVQAQYIDLQPQAPQWGLDETEIRVVQLALRDAGCYHGTINGRVTASAKAAMRCAAEKNGATLSDPGAIERALNLYAAETSTTREAGGDVAPTVSDSSVMQDTTSMMRDTTSMMQDTTSMMRDTTSMMRDTTSMMRDTTSMVQDTTSMMRDTTSMMRDSTMKRDSTMNRDSTMKRDSTMMRTMRDSMMKRDSTMRDSTRRAIPPMPPPDSTTRPVIPPPEGMRL